MKIAEFSPGNTQKIKVVWQHCTQHYKVPQKPSYHQKFCIPKEKKEPLPSLKSKKR